MTNPTPDAEPERLLLPREVAALFRVDPKTVTRWALAGRIPFVRTPGGHHRFPEQAILALRDHRRDRVPQSPEPTEPIPDPVEDTPDVTRPEIRRPDAA